MAKVMQKGAEAPSIYTAYRTPGNPMSVAEEKFRNIIGLGLEKEDDRAASFAEVWGGEIARRTKEQAPSDYCFHVYVTAVGRWAREIAPAVSMLKFPKVRKNLCRAVVSAWLGCKTPEDESYFAQAIRAWSLIETKMVLDALREMVELHLKDENRAELLPRFVRFFKGARDQSGGQEILRSILKIVVHHASEAELLDLGQFAFVRIELPTSMERAEVLDKVRALAA